MAKLNAIEFALCVLSMFGRVMDENRMALHVLLEAIKSYNPITGQFGKRAVKQAGYGGRSSLRAMAVFLGKHYGMKELRTEEGAQAVLHTILDPVIGCLTRDELVKLRRDMDEAMRLATCLPMEEVRVRVAEFAQEARENGGRERWMGVWEKAMEAQAIETSGQPSFTAVQVPKPESWKFGVIPVMSTLRRCAHVPRNCRPTAFPSPVDVCLGRSSSTSSSLSSDQWYIDTTRIWHPHGWKMFHPATAANRKRASPAGFKFPPPGMISATTSTPTATPNPVDSKHVPEMAAKLKQWQDDWETEQLGSWKAAVHKGSKRPLDNNNQRKNERCKDSWETGQLGRWTAGLDVPGTEEGGVWCRLAMAWKSKKVDANADKVQTTDLTTLPARVGRLFRVAWTTNWHLDY